MVMISVLMIGILWLTTLGHTVGDQSLSEHDQFTCERNRIDMDETFYLMKNVRAVSREMETLHTERNSLTYYFAGNDSCPSDENRKWLQDNRLDSQMTNSACPSYTVLNYDKLRIPITLLEAKCNCANCVQADGKCRPVFYYRRVLRRTTTHHTYRVKIERIAVACTCILTDNEDIV